MDDELSKSFAGGGNSENELKVRRHKVAVLRRHPLPRRVRWRLLLGSRRAHHRRRYPTRGAFGRAASFVNVLEKLPLLVYFHGGAFIIETPFSPTYHNLLNTLVSEANVIGVSVHYRRAPEHPVPVAHHDSWAALKWVASHAAGNGPEEWLKDHADLGKLFLSGDSAGANIASYLGIRVGSEGLPGVKVAGIALAHPYFWGEEALECEAKRPEDAAKVLQLWRFSCPSTSGSDDPFINPGKDPNLGKLGCERVLVFVAEKDLLKDRGWYYKELLDKSGWCGSVEVLETKEENHVFHLLNPSCENAKLLLHRIVSFIKQD